jgi:hypothetical protein
MTAPFHDASSIVDYILAGVEWLREDRNLPTTVPEPGRDGDMAQDVA